MLLLVHHQGDPLVDAVLSTIQWLDLPLPVATVHADELLRAHWHWCQDGQGEHSRLRLQDGLVVDSRELQGVFNRLRATVPPWFAKAKDREYAAMESHALVLAWLESIAAPMFNRPAARGLGGISPSIVEWLSLAGKLRVPSRRFRLTMDARQDYMPGWEAHPAPEHGDWRLGHALPANVHPGPRPILMLEPVSKQCSVTVVAKRSFGAPDNAWAAQAVELAAASSLGLVQFRLGFVEARKQWVLCNGTSHPVNLPDLAVRHLVDRLSAKSLTLKATA